MNPQLQEILHNITTRLTKLEQAEKQEPVNGYTTSQVHGYTAPPRKQWVGLTDDDLRQIILVSIGVAEAKLKEKNT